MSNDPRPPLLERLRTTGRFDLVVIGGGATGLGVAVDAAARGLSVALFESDDFAKGTSSRATKLLHGGVRYLAQGNIALVREALHERGTVLRNAPHLARRLGFVMPLYGRRGAWFDRWFYGAGLRIYDWLAASAGLADTEHLGRDATRSAVPGLRRSGLRGGIRYWDGQFDDARLALALARTAEDLGALVLNRCKVVGLLPGSGRGDDGRLRGVRVRDVERGTEHDVVAGCVVNATGVWVDGVRRLDDPASEAVVATSQGIHLVVDRHFLPGDQAVLIPRTPDGRVLFAVPWQGKVVLGTTDTPRTELDLEPRPLEQEIAFVLGESARYLERAPRLADVRSLWGGLRPLVRSNGEAATKRLSREHTILVSASGLVTVTGGKWTTYRAMAEDVLDVCMRQAGLPSRPAGRTRGLMLHGSPAQGADAGDPAAALARYGTDAAAVAALPGAARWIAPGLSEAMVRFAVRQEHARQVEDVLARRHRLLFLDAAAAAEAAPAVATVMAEELGPDFDAAGSARDFIALARQYLPCMPGGGSPAGGVPDGTVRGAAADAGAAADLPAGDARAGDSVASA